MDNSLQAESARFNDVMREMVRETQTELADVNKRIDELNALLQMKEMSVDRSENASFQIAKDERDIKVSIRSRLQKRIATFEAETGDDYSPTGFATQGSTIELSVVSIENKPPVGIKTNFIVKLVHKDLGKADKGLVAVTSKVGAALLSHRVGDTIEVMVPKGLIRYKIERLY
ncbi:MAG: GreA/GreB family elongation factor [Lachnospiraceae bacterium]|nr:GreA/GreB family elongation factor [Lachnospiraceae bacterium]